VFPLSEGILDFETMDLPTSMATAKKYCADINFAVEFPQTVDESVRLITITWYDDEYNDYKYYLFKSTIYHMYFDKKTKYTLITQYNGSIQQNIIVLKDYETIFSLLEISDIVEKSNEVDAYGIIHEYNKTVREIKKRRREKELAEASNTFLGLKFPLVIGKTLIILLDIVVISSITFFIYNYRDWIYTLSPM
jgi:hypothetical protein